MLEERRVARIDDRVTVRLPWEEVGIDDRADAWISEKNPKDGDENHGGQRDRDARSQHDGEDDRFDGQHRQRQAGDAEEHAEE